MKYVILIHHNPESRAVWDSFTPEQQQDGYAAYATLTDELEANGELILAEALADPGLAVRVHRVDDAVNATDGPYAEAKEFLAGFFLLDVASRERAIEIAGRIPEADLGQIEVRPIMDLSAIEA